MLLAILLRYDGSGNADNIWRKKFRLNYSLERLGYENNVGIIAIVNEQSIVPVCEMCDGLIIPGSGNKFDPKYYGGTPLTEPLEFDEYNFDSKVIDCFVKAGKPIFGICGGMQYLNVYFGGTVKKIDNLQNHDKECRHKTIVSPDSFVYDVYQKCETETNSHHSWELDKIANEFCVVARAQDGTVEAIECKERNIYATQWHPELCYENDNKIQDKFFKNFIEICKRKGE